jgi:TadE-like protein
MVAAQAAAAPSRCPLDAVASATSGSTAFSRCRRSETGAVTAETAVLLPALAALLVLSLWAIGVLGAQLRCIDAARTAARALARGEPEELARAAARAAAPHGARVRVTQGGDLVVVQVEATIGVPGPWSAAGLDVGSRAVAAVETSAPAGQP